MDMLHFPTVDPMAEKKPWLSPYIYCSNNPILRVDPTGRTDYVHGDGSLYKHVEDGYKGAENIDALPEVVVRPQGTWDKVSGESSEIAEYRNINTGERQRVPQVIGLKDVHPEFDVLCIGRGVISGLSSTLETKAATESSTTIFRSVSQGEMEDIAVHGLRNKAGSYETGKLFAPTLEEAAQFGKNNFHYDKLPNTIMKVDVPNNVMQNALKFEADGMNAISIPVENLQFLKATPLNYSPLIP